MHHCLKGGWTPLDVYRPMQDHGCDHSSELNQVLLVPLVRVSVCTFCQHVKIEVGYIQVL